VGVSQGNHQQLILRARRVSRWFVVGLWSVLAMVAAWESGEPIAVSASQPGWFHYHAGSRSPGHRSIGDTVAVTGENDRDGSQDIWLSLMRSLRLERQFRCAWGRINASPAVALDVSDHLHLV
jgi:hypothetical protein